MLRVLGRNFFNSSSSSKNQSECQTLGERVVARSIISNEGDFRSIVRVEFVSMRSLVIQGSMRSRGTERARLRISLIHLGGFRGPRCEPRVKGYWGRLHAIVDRLAMSGGLSERGCGCAESCKGYWTRRRGQKFVKKICNGSITDQGEIKRSVWCHWVFIDEMFCHSGRVYSRRQRKSKNRMSS